MVVNDASNLRVALITSAILPNKITLAISSYDRLQQTIASLRALYAQSMFDKVYLVDGTGFNFTAVNLERYFPENWLEIHSFQQDNYLVEKYGTSFGEALIQNYFLQNVCYDELPLSIYKLSGRYVVENIGKIIHEIDGVDSYFFTFYPRFMEYRKYVQTAFYKINKGCMRRSIDFAMHYIMQHPGVSLERAFYAWIESEKFSRKWKKAPLPIFSGTSGKSGQSLKKLAFPYNFFKLFDFMPLMGFVYGGGSNFKCKVD